MKEDKKKLFHSLLRFVSTIVSSRDKNTTKCETEDYNKIEKSMKKGEEENEGKSVAEREKKYIALAYCARGLPRIMRDWAQTRSRWFVFTRRQAADLVNSSAQSINIYVLSVDLH